MKDGRARKLEHKRGKRGQATCLLCGKEQAFRRGHACAQCQQWLEQYTGHTLYNRDRLTLRQLHALRQRAEQHLPLFEGGHLYGT